MELGNIMTKSVATVSMNTSVQEAARLMKEHNVGALPVCDGDKIEGMITDRDIVLKSVAGGSQIDRMTCGEIMTANPVVGTVNMDVHEAAKIMADNQIRRLPVVDNGRLVGIVALGDLAVEPIFVNEAGDALNNISKPSEPIM